MKHLILISLILVMAACGGGGGGTETKTVVQADPTPPSSGNSSSGTTDNSLTSVDVPEDFDFSNFQTVSVDFIIPGDLVGQVDFKIYGQWNDEVQDLIIGRGYGGLEKSVQLNIPTTISVVTIDFIAFDKASGNYEVRSEEITL